MQIEFDKEEVEFLLESLKYAQIYYDERVSKYPAALKETYYKSLKPEKEQMFQRVMDKLHTAKRQGT